MATGFQFSSKKEKSKYVKASFSARSFSRLEALHGWHNEMHPKELGQIFWRRACHGISERGKNKRTYMYRVPASVFALHHQNPRSLNINSRCICRIDLQYTVTWREYIFKYKIFSWRLTNSFADYRIIIIIVINWIVVCDLLSTRKNTFKRNKCNWDEIINKIHR